MAIVAAVGLLGYPLYLIYAITVPVPRFRTGTYVDFLTFAATVFAVYGGVLLGVSWRVARAGRAWRLVRPVEIMKAGIWGALSIGALVIVAAGARGLAGQGSFEKGVGNLWGLILIFALVFGALVSGGVALVSFAMKSNS